MAGEREREQGYRSSRLAVPDEDKAPCRNVVPLRGSLKFFQVITRLPQFWQHYWQRVIFMTSGLSALDGSLISSPVLKDLHGVFRKEAGTVFSDGALVHLPAYPHLPTLKADLPA